MSRKEDWRWTPKSDKAHRFTSRGNNKDDKKKSSGYTKVLQRTQGWCQVPVSRITNVYAVQKREEGTGKVIRRRSEQEVGRDERSHPQSKGNNNALPSGCDGSKSLGQRDGTRKPYRRHCNRAGCCTGTGEFGRSGGRHG